jgi:tetratricopeptide (TPR) repeat protein
MFCLNDGVVLSRMAVESTSMDMADKLSDVQLLLAEGRFDDAAAVCQEILAVEPESPEAFIALGQSARGMGDHAAAFGHFQAAAEHLPRDIWRKLDVVEELMALSRLDDAAVVCQEILAVEPDNPQAFIALGQCARRGGDHVASLGYFQTAAEHLPQDIWRKLDVVEELMALGRFTDAAAICREILAVDPDNPQVLITLGLCVRGSGNRAGSLVHFQAAAERLPQDIWRKLDVVEDLMALGRLDEAEFVCQEILAIAPDNPQVLIAMGQCTRRRGDRAASLGHFQAAAAQLPQDVWRKLDVVEDLLSMERFEEGEAVCREVLAIEPDNAQTLIILSQIIRRNGERGASLACLQAASSRLPQDIYLKLTIVGDLLALGRADEAERIYRGILVLEPHSFSVESGARQLTADDRVARLTQSFLKLR